MPLSTMLLSAGLLLEPTMPSRSRREVRLPTHAAAFPLHERGVRLSTLVAAHRAGFFGAQNTMRQIIKSLREGDADILEMDLRRSGDGTIVVFHDPSLGRKTTCNGTVEGMSAARLARCRLRASGSRIAGFDEVLERVRGKAVVDAEFTSDAVIAPAIALVRKWNARDWVYFQVGANRKRYRLARELGPEIALQFKAATDADLSWALSLHDNMLTVIEMDRDFINPVRIRRVHAAGKLVSENTWRYQFTEERWQASCAQAFEMGVDVAVTNNPSSCAAQRRHPARSTIERLVGEIFGRQRVRVAFRSFVAWIRSVKWLNL